ncbi:proline-rich transmembrane protein 1-like [Glandiceps talaboti]
MTGRTGTENKVSPEKKPEKDGLPPPYVVNDTMVSMPPAIVGPRSIVSPRDVPRDYLGFSLFTAIFCFWPVGLVAVIKSRNVHRDVWRGDMSASHHSSLWAKRLSIISLVLGLICWGLIIAWKLRWLWCDKSFGGDHREGHHHGRHHDDDDDDDDWH